MSDNMDWRNIPDLKWHTHSYLFALALRQDSNLAMDWLWLADQLDDALERQYCLQRAHYIDPACVVVSSQPGLVAKFKNLVQAKANLANPSAHFLGQ